MVSVGTERDRADGKPDTVIDSRIKPLLDHVASELAREYIRLMEAAASAESADNVEIQSEGERE